MKVKFMSSKHNDDKQLMQTKNDNIETMISNEADEIINKLLESLLTKYQLEDLEGLEESMKGSDFVFDSINEIHYKCNKIKLNR